MRYSNEIYYLPNLLSVLRILLLIPLSYLMIFDFESKNTLIIAIVLCMYFSDLLDGYLARRMNLVSEFGKIIDPLADKISVTVIALILLYLGKIPLWFVLIIVLRDVFILAFGIYLNKKRDIRLMSNYPGKIAVFFIGVVLLFSIINSPALTVINSYLYIICILLIIYSSYLYYKRFREAVK